MSPRVLNKLHMTCSRQKDTRNSQLSGVFLLIPSCPLLQASFQQRLINEGGICCFIKFQSITYPMHIAMPFVKSDSFQSGLFRTHLMTIFVQSSTYTCHSGICTKPAMRNILISLCVCSAV